MYTGNENVPESGFVNSNVASSPFNAQISATENAQAFSRSREENTEI